MPVNAEDVRKQQKQMNNWKLPLIPERSRKFADQHPVYIYNVSDQRFLREMGSLGAFTVFACEEGQEHSKPTRIPGIVFEHIPVEMFPKKMEVREIDGQEVANAIIGLGPHMNKAQAIDKWGIFASENYPPTKQELAAANARLLETYHALVAEADAYAAEGPQELKNITSLHRKALAKTNQTRAWQAESRQMVLCEGCQESILPNVVKHTCGAVRDWDKAYKLHLVSKAEYEQAVADGLTKKKAS